MNEFRTADEDNLILSAPDETHERPNRLLSSELRVLCVDDNVDGADSLSAMLGMMGFTTAVAHDAGAGLRLVDEFRPQACILDITMPGMTGYELAQRLRAREDGEKLLLIALTALGDYAALERMADSGFDLHYTKPVSPTLLVGVLNDFIERGRPA